ncbi:MAG: mobile mystery protein A, partial [Phenylobacterium sp.]
MSTATEQLDRRFAELTPITALARPPRGWIRAIRDALGMTTGQLAGRIGVAQTRVSEMERSEIAGKLTLQSLERAAEAMGCRVVYALVPVRPLSQVIRERA